MTLIYNELKYYVKKRVTWLAILMLSAGAVLCAWQSVAQETRVMSSDNVYLQGKEAVLYKEQQTKALEGTIESDEINQYLQQLYQLNQQTPLSQDEKINLLFRSDYIKYDPYTGFLLKVYDKQNQDDFEVYNTLYSLGSKQIDIYQEWKTASKSAYANVNMKQQKDVERLLAEVTLPFQYRSNPSLTVMISKLQDMMLFLYIVIAIMFASSFSKDRATKSDQIIQTSSLGRKQLRNARIHAGTILSTLLFLYTVAVYGIVILSQIGIGGFDASIQMSICTLSPYDLTLGQAFGRMLLFAYLMNMIITMLIMYVSCKTKRAYFVILLSFLLLFISYMVISTSTFEGILRYFLMLLPFGLFEKTAIFSYCNVWIGSFSIWYPWIVCISYLCIFMLLRWRILKRGI